jgi:hypothetical protein
MESYFDHALPMRMLRSGLNFLLTQECLYIKHICIAMKYASGFFANPLSAFVGFGIREGQKRVVFRA